MQIGIGIGIGLGAQGGGGDAVAPTCVITCDQASPTAAASLTFTYTWSEDVTGFVIGDAGIANGTKGAFTAVDASHYTLVVTPDAFATVTATVAAGVCQDAAGNDNAEATPLVIIGAVDVIIPTGFTALTLPFTIQQSGVFFRAKDWDVSSLRPSGGITYYVDPVNGSDDGGAFDGSTWAKAFKSIATATPDAKNAQTITCKPGIYGPTLSGGYYVDGGWIGSLGNKASALICEGGQAILTPRILQSYSAVDSHYESTSSQISSVMDTSATEVNGQYKKYALAANAAAVDATAGTFYWTSNVLYVHTFDNRAPDANIYALRNSTSGLLFTASAARTLYMENCTVLFSTDRLVRVSQQDATARISAYFKNCVFSHQVSSPANYDLLDIDGGVDVIAQSCIAEYGVADGFNYHRAPYTGIPTSVEIDCIGRYCGISGATQNGSSTHEGAPVVRLSSATGLGDYHHSYGAPIGDVGGTAGVPGTQVWNLGIASHHSLTATIARNTGFLVGNGGDVDTEMWLDSCHAHDNTYDLAPIEGQKMYTRNCILSAGQNYNDGGGGTIAPY